MGRTLGDRGTVDRRSVIRGGLVAGLGTAAVAGGLLSTRGPQDDAMEIALAAGEPDAATQLGFVSVKAAPHNATGNGNSDDTAAIVSAYNAARAAKASLYFPSGSYKVSSLPQFDSLTTVRGAGADATTIIYTGTGTMLALRDRQRVAFKNLGFWAAGNGGTLISLDNCFRCSFESVMLRGSHTAATNPRYLGQIGVSIASNTGGTSFSNCDINNFGVGISTSAIQNYITNSKFTTNWISLRGTGNNFASGMAISNTEFVSDINVKSTDKHIHIDGRASDWWLTNVWIEGAATAIAVGAAGVGGPSQFGMVNCKIAARTVDLDLMHCRQPYLANVAFDADQNAQPQLLKINAANVPEGVATNLITSVGADFPMSTFPAGWTVTGRAKHLAAGGPLVRSPNGKIWKLAVSNTGQVSAVDAGNI
ncbi:glycosyl hydrolase family 28-related protein [Rhodococcus sp. P1Y]|uniref:glycosyl hydrolase family 28-related protein n=1 Tax=Rhodococcus sp. P1Y TaxID=1302308 RepID=UPI000EB104AF|nr:glycosyl hydrolase family 28-related protein [Rhodococcus sp. P1Y]AYJ48173.1 mannuronan epimerase [Rhodococcus sp. P1Y]